MKITEHFIKRYCERMLNCDCVLCGENSESAIFSDIMGRLTDHQKKAFDFFVGANIDKVFIPVGDRHRICLKNDFAITIY